MISCSLHSFGKHMQMNPLQRLKRTFTFIALLVALFAFHRLMVKEYIGLDLTGDVATQVQVFGVGLLSDLWIAIALALPYFFNTSRFYLNLVYISTGVALALQVPYVEFFRTSLRWIHLSYLADFEFLRSSTSSLGRPRFWFSILFAAFLLTVFFRKSPEITKTRTSYPLLNAALFLLIVAIGAVSNALSQKLTRTQNFSVKLTQNFIVQLVLDGIETTKTERSIKFDDSDLRTLQIAQNQYLQRSTNLTDHSPALLLRNADKSGFSQNLGHTKNSVLTSEKPQTPALEFLARKMRESFTEKILKTENRYFFVVILESMRAAESRLLTPATRGFTENLDRLSEKGIAFRAGYSSSVVSRAGAESSVCNFISTIALNTMRDTPIERAKCARELFQENLEKQGIKSSYSWLHGGYHGFDNQGLFYKTAGFEIPFDILKLPRELPRTDWGISDKSLVSLSNSWLKIKDRETSSGLHFSALVTVSNHTAWTLPPDAHPQLSSFQNQSPARHFATVKYSDAALGQWVEQLKLDGIWKKSVVIFVGDHGMQDYADGVGAIPGFGHDATSDKLTADHLTRVYFSMSGGIVESAVAFCQQKKLCESGVIMNHAVSQIDILPTLAQMLSLQEFQPWFGVSLLSPHRLWPVFSDLGDFYFIPQAQQHPVVSKQMLHSASEKSGFVSEWNNFRSYINLYSTLVRQGKLRESLYGEFN